MGGNRGRGWGGGGCWLPLRLPLGDGKAQVVERDRDQVGDTAGLE